MSATTNRRRRAETMANPGDHRATAIAVAKSVAQQAASIWGAADGMAEHAWCLLDTAASLGEKLVERNEPDVVDHAGGLACYIRDFHAALHGVRALIMEMAEKDWSADDEAAMAMIQTAGPQLRDVQANLERQRHWEVDLGNRPATHTEVAKVGDQAADAWSPCAYAKEVAAALLEQTSEPVFGVLVKTTTRALEAIQDSGAAPADEQIAARAAAELEEAHALALYLRRNHEVSLLEGATEMLLKVAIDAHRAARRQMAEAA